MWCFEFPGGFWVWLPAACVRGFGWWLRVGGFRFSWCWGWWVLRLGFRACCLGFDAVLVFCLRRSALRFALVGGLMRLGGVWAWVCFPAWGGF